MPRFKVYIPAKEVTVENVFNETDAAHKAADSLETHNWEVVQDEKHPICPHCKTRGQIIVIEHGVSVAFPVNGMYGEIPQPCYDVPEFRANGHTQEYYCNACNKKVYEDEIY